MTNPASVRGCGNRVRVLCSVIAAAVTVAVAGGGCGAPAPAGSHATAARTGFLSTGQAPPAVAAPAPAAAPVTFPTNGSRKWQYAAGSGSALAAAGVLERFRVAVEADIAGITADDFAREAAVALGEAGGWATGGRWRLQQVGGNDRADFTIYLVTPGTRDVLCRDGFDMYTSCTRDSSVVINVRRWQNAVPDYGAPLSVYRKYVINHETGHWLGYGHQRCPAAGKAAPVMQQQTLGLHGCTANPSPYVNGALYQGPIGEYHDPIPRDVE